MPAEWEYLSVVYNGGDLAAILNEYASAGWRKSEIVKGFYDSTGREITPGSTIVFERPVARGAPTLATAGAAANETRSEQEARARRAGGNPQPGRRR